MPMSAEASRASSALNSPAECGVSRASSGPTQGGTGSVKGLPKNPLEGGPGMSTVTFVLSILFSSVGNSTHS
jgi:hypothetical protein